MAFSDMNMEIEVRLDNLDEIRDALNRFPEEMTNSMYRRLQRSAAREEKILKSTREFKDRTGYLRNTMAVVATYRPIGIYANIFAWYAKYVAHAHGTWNPRWWYEFIGGFMTRIPKDLSKALEEVVKLWNERKV